MADNFGEPVYEEAQQPGQDVAAEDTKHPFVDPNDPRLTSESKADDTSKNAYDVPPPPPDGKWRAKLKMVDIKHPGDGKMYHFISQAIPNLADGCPFYAVNIEASLIDLTGKYDGAKITEYWVKSILDERRGTSQMSTIATKAGAQLPKSSTDRVRLETLMKVLAGEPEVVLETAWEASCANCQAAAKKKGEKAPRPFLLGMHRFPQTRAGSDPYVPCPACKSQVRAQVRIVNFFGVAEVKATRGLA